MMIGHYQEEWCLASAAPGREGTGAISLLPVLGINEVNSDAATSGDIQKMGSNRFGLMT